MDENGNYILKGTTVLPWTDNYRTALYQYGYYLSELSSTDCENQGDRIEEMSDLVVTAQTVDSTIHISIKKIANCSDQFLGEIEIVGDTIINLITHGYGGHSTCACCFGLEYTIETEGINDHIRFVMIDGDRRTLREME